MIEGLLHLQFNYLQFTIEETSNISFIIYSFTIYN